MMRRVFLGFAFVAAALALAASAVLAGNSASAVKLPDVRFDTFTLPNGLQVILHEDHSTPIVAFDIWYHVGSKNERARRTGFAHLFEHMMFQGSQHNEAEYFGPIQEVGGILNGSTNTDRTNYWEVMPANYLERGLMVEADRMGWLLPSMTQEKLANQQEVVRNERRQSSENQPYGVFWLNLNEMMYPPEHPYGHSVIGSHEDLEAATLDDVKEFFRTYYTPSNATLCIGGDFNPQQARALVEKYFSAIPAGRPVQKMDQWVPEWATDRRTTMEDRVQLPRVYMIWHSPAYFAPGEAELSLLGRILAEGKDSRLYKRLVYTDQIAQDAIANQWQQEIAGLFAMWATAKPGHTADQLESALNEEIARVIDKGVTAAELSRAKASFESEFINGWARVGAWGGKVDKLNEYNHYVGRPDYLKEDFARTMDVSVADINAAARKWLTRGKLVAHVVPFGNLKEIADNADRSRIPAAGGPAPSLKLPPIQRDTLPNGLTLLLMEQHELPVVEFNMVFRTGSAADPQGLPGLAGFTADMLDEGTKTRSALELSEAKRELGAEMYVGSGWDGITAYIGSLRKNLDPTLSLLADVVRNPAFAGADVERVRKSRQTQVLQNKDNQQFQAQAIAAHALYPESHPYAWTELGTDKALAQITPDQMRDFYTRSMVPANATLIAVGDLTMDEFKRAATASFGTWQGGQAPRSEVASAPQLPGRKLVLVDKPGATQSVIAVAQLGLARGDQDEFAVRVMNHVLGGQFMSRINLNLREDKGYTYGARSFFDMRRGQGPFVATASVQTEVTAPAVQEFMKELRDVHGSRPLSEKELADGRNGLTLGFPRQFETAGDLAGKLSDLVLYNLPADYFDTYVRNIEAVDLAAANHAGKQHVLPDNAAVVVVGDLTKIQSSLLDLKLGPVEYRDLDGNLIAPEQVSQLGR